MTQPAAFSLQRKSVVLALVLALLWAQSLGLAHRMVHATPASHSGKQFCGQPAASNHAQARPHAQCQGHSNHAGLMGHLESAPGDHPADCRLFDQLSQGETFPCSGQLLSPLRRLEFSSPKPAPGFWHTFTALYAARAPPLIL